MAKNTHDQDTTRLLAHSLLYEALYDFGLLAILPREPAHKNRVWDRQGILQAVRRFVKREGHLPTAREWQKAGQYHLPARDTVQRYWGSIKIVHQAIRRQRGRG